MSLKKLSVLDFGYFMPPEVHAIDTLNFTFEFVRNLESLGYNRYWMAEHYNDYCSWTNPEILIAVIAGSTEKLIIGAAGIAVFYHNPYKVATAFKMMAALYPNRIDLGIARGTIPPHMIKHLTEKNKMTKRVIQNNVRKLLDYFSNDFLYKETKEYVPLPPYGTGLPKRWLLGSSLSSANYANELNVNFSLSTFHNSQPVSYYSEIIKRYKEDYFEKFDELPEFNVAVQCTCIQNPVELKKFISESNMGDQSSDDMKIAGNQSYCVDKMSEFYEILDTSEIIVYDHNRNLEQRLACVSLLGEGLIGK